MVEFIRMGKKMKIKYHIYKVTSLTNRLLPPYYVKAKDEQHAIFLVNTNCEIKRNSEYNYACIEEEY